jgi:phosphomannomutase
LSAAVVEGLLSSGADVIDLGLCGTEEMYFATAHFGACGGIEITASHNPMEYNGMKLVGRGSAPLDPVAEMTPIRRLAESGTFSVPRRGGSLGSGPIDCSVST